MSSLQSRVLVAVIGVPVLVWVVLWAPPLVMLVALCRRASAAWSCSAVSAALRAVNWWG